jgi:hypothetical protein
VCRFVLDVRGMSGVVGWPNSDTNSFLVGCGDFKLRICDKGVKYLVPLDEEPGVIDEFKG